MPHRIFAFAVALILFSSLYGQSSAHMKDLRIKIEEVLSGRKGYFAVAFRNLQSNDTLMVNGHTGFHAASTMKVAVMIELYRQVKEGRFSLSDSFILHNSFKSIVDGSPFQLDSADDSERALYRHLGEKRTLRELMYQMITVSSNLATNMIIELVSPEKVTATAYALGAEHLQVLRGVEDNKAYEKGLNNSTTAFDLMVLLGKIATCKAVDQQASEEMKQILLDQQFNEIIPSRLPAGVKVAHKTGNITGVEHDAGIIYLPDGRKYILVLLSKQLEDKQDGINAMAIVSEIVYQHMIHQK